jgi:hypothetical protein
MNYGEENMSEKQNYFPLKIQKTKMRQKEGQYISLFNEIK